MNKELKISVCMASYNGEKYIKDQIESILRNIREQDELIISDDGSKDNTVKIIQEYVLLDKRIHLVAGPKMGVVKNFETCIKHASGDIIFLSDQDDLWLENKVNTVLKAFQSESCMVVIHDATVIDGSGKVVNESFYDLKKSGSGFWKNVWKNTYIGCCMAFRKEMLEVLFPIPPKVPMHDQWIGLWGDKMGENIFLEESLLLYRRHEDNASGMSHLPFGKMIRNRWNILYEFMKRDMRK